MVGKVVNIQAWKKESAVSGWMLESAPNSVNSPPQEMQVTSTKHKLVHIYSH